MVKGDEWRPWPLLSRAQIETSPSFLLGMNFKVEKKLREAACKVVGEAGKILDQGIVPIATAQMYLMRFFAIKPYQHNDSFIVAVAALFVASKTENKPRALADIAHACWRNWVDIWVKEQKRRHKDQPAAYWEQKGQAQKHLFKDPAFYKRLSEAATTAERVLLYTTGFQFNVHTGFYALLVCKSLLVKHPDPAVARFFVELELQIVWNFVIECYRSTRLCLQFDPRTIGIACYEMTCKHLNRQIPLVDGEVWWKYVAKDQEWDVNVANPEEVKIIQDELWAVFEPKKKGGNPPNGMTPKAECLGSRPGTPAAVGGTQAVAANPTPGAPSVGPSTTNQRQGASTSGRQPVQTEPSGLRTQAAQETTNKATAVSATPDGGTDGPVPRQQFSTAQVKQKESASAGVHFSPSDEFSVSPRGSAPDDSAQTSQPMLLAAPESGELILEPPSDKQGVQQTAALKQARLLKARALAQKRKMDGPPQSAPEAKRKSPSPGLGVEFEP